MVVKVAEVLKKDKNLKGRALGSALGNIVKPYDTLDFLGAVSEINEAVIGEFFRTFVKKNRKEDVTTLKFINTTKLIDLWIHSAMYKTAKKLYLKEKGGVVC